MVKDNDAEAKQAFKKAFDKKARDIHQEDREVLLSAEDDEDVLKEFGLHK